MLSAIKLMPLVAKSEAVLMHLLVLGAFCREIRDALYASEDLVLMHLLVLGAFCPPLPLGTASLRHFQGLERHRLPKHPAGPASTAPI